MVREKNCILRSFIFTDGKLSTVAGITILCMVFTIGGRAQLGSKVAPIHPSKMLGPIGSDSHLSDVFGSVLPRIKAKSHLPVLLPSELPQPFAKAKYTNIETATDDDYDISLYYELGVEDAGFAASFAAKGHPNYAPRDLPNVQEVRLSRGLVGYFRPVGCGGSCAPANIWWEDGRVLYQIQLEFSSTVSEGDQRKAITSTANSAIIAGPR
jgi:hypothetical protein